MMSSKTKTTSGKGKDNFDRDFFKVMFGTVKTGVILKSV